MSSSSVDAEDFTLLINSGPLSIAQSPVGVGPLYGVALTSSTAWGSLRLLDQSSRSRSTPESKEGTRSAVAGSLSEQRSVSVSGESVSDAHASQMCSQCGSVRPASDTAPQQRQT